MNSEKRYEIDEASKQELLIRLQRELSTWRQRRRILRQTTWSLGLLLVIGIGIVAEMSLTKSPTTESDHDSTLAKQSEPESPVQKIAEILAPPKASNEYSAIKVERIDDSALLSILNDLGQPSFFATVEGKKRLIREKM